MTSKWLRRASARSTDSRRVRTRSKCCALGGSIFPGSAASRSRRAGRAGDAHLRDDARPSRNHPHSFFPEAAEKTWLALRVPRLAREAHRCARSDRHGNRRVSSMPRHAQDARCPAFCSSSTKQPDMTSTTPLDLFTAAASIHRVRSASPSAAITAGFELKNSGARHFSRNAVRRSPTSGRTAKESVDYNDFAEAVVAGRHRGRADFGILMCCEAASA